MDGNTDIAETAAAMDFINWFNSNYSGTKCTSCYNFKVTNLRRKISEIRKHPDGLLIFYLHDPKSEFSKNFCCFLQNPEIENVFQKRRYRLYCWDIGNKILKRKLICAINSCLGDRYSSYIEEKKSVVLTIKIKNKKPLVFNAFSDAADLVKLHSLLTGEEVSQEVDGPVTPLSFQKSMADHLGDRDYDCFEHDEHKQLKMKIGFALYGVPMEQEGTAYSKKQQQHINKLFGQILKQNNKFCKWNGKIVISFVYICAEPLPSEKDKKAQHCAKKCMEYNREADFKPHPIFVLRKCKHSNPFKACRIIIDDEGRVYHSWSNYLECNKLCPCKMTYPKVGRYTPSPGDTCITYMTRLSPSCNICTKVASIMDKVLTIGGLIAGGMTVFVAAPIFSIPAAAVGITSGVYATARNIQTLVDRGTHKQGLHPLNPESRGAYLNIAGGLLNVALFGSLRTIAFLASRGVAFGQGTQYVLYSINGVTLTVGGLGIGNSVYHMVSSKKRPSPVLLSQLGASVFFFGNALYNFRNISGSIDEGKAQVLAQIANDLRGNRLRRTFNKVLRRMMRSHSKEKALIIASIRLMNDVNAVIRTLRRNDSLNSQGIQYSLENGEIRLNGMPVKINELGMITKMDQGAFLESFPPILTNLKPNNKQSITRAIAAFFNETAINTILKFHSDETINDLVEEVFCAFEKHVREFILNVAKSFLTDLDTPIVNRLKTIFTSEFFGSVIIRWIVNTVKNTTAFKKVAQKENLSSEEVAQVVIDMKDRFRCWFTRFNYDEAKREERKENRRKYNVIKMKKNCEICGGYYYC